MGNLINRTHGTTTREIITREVAIKDGNAKLEVHLVLDINISADGVKVSTGVNTSTNKIVRMENKEQPTDWVMPDFDPTERVQFGKQETKEK